jgi:hypothetical protein
MYLTPDISRNVNTQRKYGGAEEILTASRV